MLNPECLEKSTEIVENIPPDYFEDPNNSPFKLVPNHRSFVYRYHIQNSIDYDDWDSMRSIYLNTEDVDESERALQALASTRLNWILDE